MMGKTNTVLGIPRRNFKEGLHELREIAHFSNVRSILEYGSTVCDVNLK